MANKITTNVYTNFGETYQTDVYVSHPSKRCNIQDLDEGSIVVGLDFYRSQEDFQNKRKPLKPVS